MIFLNHKIIGIQAFATIHFNGEGSGAKGVERQVKSLLGFLDHRAV
jgi:hypothetical protein